MSDNTTPPNIIPFPQETAEPVREIEVRNIYGTDAQERKDCPIWRGCLNYFPNALAAVARISKRGNDQHHPDKPLHWDMSKSTDEADCLVRHLTEGEFDAVAWRALALLERHLTGNMKDNTY